MQNNREKSDYTQDEGLVQDYQGCGEGGQATSYASTAGGPIATSHPVLGGVRSIGGRCRYGSLILPPPEQWSPRTERRITVYRDRFLAVEDFLQYAYPDWITAKEVMIEALPTVNIRLIRAILREMWDAEYIYKCRRERTVFYRLMSASPAVAL